VPHLNYTTYYDYDSTLTPVYNETFSAYMSIANGTREMLYDFRICIEACKFSKVDTSAVKCIPKTSQSVLDYIHQVREEESYSGKYINAESCGGEEEVLEKKEIIDTEFDLFTGTSTHFNFKAWISLLTQQCDQVVTGSIVHDYYPNIFTDYLACFTNDIKTTTIWFLEGERAIAAVLLQSTVFVVDNH
jgi:hypothetical protein